MWGVWLSRQRVSWTGLRGLIKFRGLLTKFALATIAATASGVSSSSVGR